MDGQNGIDFNSRVLATKDIDWRALKFLQQEEFKDLSDVDRQKLKNSLTGNQFIQPFYVWEDPTGILYCLDGKHRIQILNELVTDGVNVPDQLPAVFIDCADKKEASKLVLVFSSAYARVTDQGLKDFISFYELDLPDLLKEISIPELHFEEMMPVPPDLDGDPKEKPATMKITFENAKQLESAIPDVEELLKKFTNSFFSVSAGEI